LISSLARPTVTILLSTLSVDFIDRREKSANCGVHSSIAISIYMADAHCAADVGILEEWAVWDENPEFLLRKGRETEYRRSNSHFERRSDMNGEGGALLTWWNRGLAPLSRATFLAGLFTLVSSMTQTAWAQSGYSIPNNYPPVAQDDFAMTMEEMPVTIAVLNNDYGMTAPLNPSSVDVIAGPLHGEVVIDPSTGNAWYFPDTEFYGMDAFTYVVSNSNGQVSNVATVSVGVMPRPPIIQNLAAEPIGNSMWVFTGQVLDLHPAGITVTFSGLISGSVTTEVDGSFRYSATPPPGTSGEVDVQAQAHDGLLSQVVSEYVYNR
jgi:hypothetical protein